MASSKPLHSAAGTGQDEEPISMIAYLVEIANATDEAKENHAIGTPVPYAIVVQFLAKLKSLLQRGADPYKPIGRAGSPLKLFVS